MASRPITLTMSAPSKLVRDFGNLGAQLLCVRDAGTHPTLEDSIRREEQREDREPDRREHGSTSTIWTAPASSMTMTPRGHGQRHEDAPRCLDIGIGVGEQLPGRMSLMPRERQAEVLPGDLPSVGSDVEHREAAGDAPQQYPDRGQHDHAPMTAKITAARRTSR